MKCKNCNGKITTHHLNKCVNCHSTVCADCAAKNDNICKNCGGDTVLLS